MKKSLILLTALALSFAGYSQEEVKPIIEGQLYILKISPNGNYLGSMSGSATLVAAETLDSISYSGCYLGLGNCITNNGVAVGNANDLGVIMNNGQITYPPALLDYWFCDIHGITPDGSRICGQVNTDGLETLYMPFVADVDANGVVQAPVMLPYPEKDFFGMAPQFVTAVNISNDGKTIVGQVLDWRGGYTYPIYYTEKADGEWTYELPSKSLFNTTNIDFPVPNPWFDEPSFPEPENFMTGLKREGYLAAFEEYSVNGGVKPDPFDYMNETQQLEYLNAVNEYNAWYYPHEDEIKEYVKIYDQILNTSVSFRDNDFAIDPAGSYFIMQGGVVDENFDMEAKLYKFNIGTSAYETYDTPTNEFYPSQILPNGTLVITKGKMDIPTSYLMLPGSKKFITLQEYFQDSYPEISEWLDKTLPGGTGVVCINDDMTIFTGALMPDQYGDNYDYDDPNAPLYSSFIIKLETSGINGVEAESNDGVNRVYNLNGVKVLETTEGLDLNTLAPGIYIVNGKKTVVK